MGSSEASLEMIAFFWPGLDFLLRTVTGRGAGVTGVAFTSGTEGEDPATVGMKRMTSTTAKMLSTMAAMVLFRFSAPTFN